ncbi:Qat anti-phage system ATPase QatA [Colwellia ponticola]|uniref:KAP P-loop n=1 Tax=Colwellia ponticola TaxID=2304625 RepID=A0A8H2JLH2_9GAMM|nr:Qat anti-phage system ATPase QatA [Colwellia ponticola]TMM45728.1 KAP P-loop [Colwellia ponticola]
MLWPDNETDLDLLNYQSISSAITKLLEDSKKLPISVGVHGDWGAGKSSILSMLEKQYAHDESTACIRFNGWLFQGLEDAQSALMQQIISELIKQRSGIRGFKQKAEKFYKRIDWLKTAKTVTNWGATAFTGMPTPETLHDLKAGFEKLTSSITEISAEDAKAKVKELSKCINEPKKERVVKEITEFRKEYKKLIEAAKIERLVILVDDLDRCLPETAISTLEAMKLFLFMPNTAFVIAADETMIEYSVRRHFPKLNEEIGGRAYTRNYLEKLIQVPFRIPALSEKETGTYLQLLIAQSLFGAESDEFKCVHDKAKEILRTPWKGSLLETSDIQEAIGRDLIETEKEKLLMVSTLSTVLTIGTKGNPRQIKRFLNAFITRMLVAEGAGYADAINESTLIKIMLLEQFNESAYNLLRDDCFRNNDGISEALNRMEEMVDQPPTSDTSTQDTTANLFDLEKDKWLKEWVSMEPALSKCDLTPYLYLTRERVRFITSSGRNENVARCLPLLLGDKLKVTSATSLVKKLNNDESKSLMDILITKITTTCNTSDAEGYFGAWELCKHFRELQLPLLKTIENLPTNKIGPWVTTGAGGIDLTDEAETMRVALLTKWSKLEGKSLLASASKTALKSNKRN